MKYYSLAKDAMGNYYASPCRSKREALRVTHGLKLCADMVKVGIMGLTMKDPAQVKEWMKETNF